MTPHPSPSAPTVNGTPSTHVASTADNGGIAIRHDLLLYVNGERVHVPEKNVQPEQTLLQFLRTELKLTGTKLGCGEGGCGACTVMVSKFDVKANEVRHFSVNSCLTPVCAMDTCAVTTVEGVGHITGDGTDATGLHPVQQAIAESHGSQCGYCTPGFIMALYAMVKQRETGRHLTMEEIEHGMDGNLCRCTGYRPILDAAKSFGVDAQDSKCKGDCPGCPNKGKEPLDIEDMGHNHGAEDENGVQQVTSCSSDKIRSLAKKWESKLKRKTAAAATTASSEFPVELQQKALQPEYLQINGSSVQWFAPVTLPQLLALKAQHPHAKISVGNTEMGIETKFKHLKYGHLINVNRVPELVAMSHVDANDAIHQSGLTFGDSQRAFEGVKFGAAVTLTDVKEYLSDCVKTLPTHQTHTFTSIIKMLKWFASTHIRNVACLAGNIVTASPISDMNPLLAAMNAYVELRSADTQQPRYVCVRDFFLAYRKVDLAPSEVVTSVYVPFTKKWEYMLPFKQAKRREDDISIVTAGIRVRLAPADDVTKWVITEASLVYGGMAPLTKAAAATEQFLIGQSFDMATIDAACDVIHQQDFILPVGVPGGMARYRESLCASFLYKFLVAATKTLEQDRVAETTTSNSLPAPFTIAENVQSAGESFVLNPRESSRGMQAFGLEKGGMTTSKHKPAGDDTTTRGPVGDPLMHKSAYLQVTGEALYTDDIPTTPDTLHAAFVLSTHAHALIKGVDATEALAIDGVRAFVDASVFAKHRLGLNSIGAVLKDEQCFATDKVVCVGQPIGMIVADSHELATEAAEKVKIVYEELPSIITIQDAIRAQSFFPPPHVIDDGDVEVGFAQSDIVLEGEFSMGGQEQFYFETNVSLCTPTEGGMKVVSSTQAATKAQALVSRVLGIPENRVVSTSKRIGGGFGGKETRTAFVSCAAAVVAKILKRPVKCLLERHIDMLATGGRHPFYSKYKIGVTKDGLIQALEVDLYNNAGYSLDLSMAVMDRALFHCDNAYKIPHLRATGRVCKTNMPTNTAFRGFGGPQGLAIAETYIDHIARTLQIAPEEIRSRNMYCAGQITHFGQPLEPEFDLRSLWQRALTKSEFVLKKQQVEAFNKLHRFKKRGVAIIPTKFGISFTAKFMNQGGALVHVYADGSVLVNHGGIEMGQGLHTKVIQVAARAFGVSHDQVHIDDTCTSKVANTQPSAASMSTDLYGMATLDACEQIMARLAPIRQQLGADASFQQVAHTAYMARIDLSAHGFYIVPSERCGYDFTKTVKENAACGTAFNYFTTGVACTEVELDVLTGDFHMLAVDVAMDLGASINPAIDVGQIEGAFMQGFGLFAMEELVWGDDGHPWVKRGHLFTRGPGGYKIPSMNDLPVDFNVWLDSGKKNRFAVHSSKAVGEPPLFLGSSAFFAIKEAIYAARQDAGVQGYFELKSPVTPERARMACGGELLQKVFTARGEDMLAYQPSGSF